MVESVEKRCLPAQSGYRSSPQPLRANDESSSRAVVGKELAEIEPRTAGSAEELDAEGDIVEGRVSRQLLCGL